MLRLLLLRHAKAADASERSSDIDRPLAPRGEREAARIGEMMAEAGLMPARILCSTALRTRQTLSQMLPPLLAAMPDGGDIKLAGELYGAGRDYLDIVKSSGGGAPSLLLIGHNPATHQTARLLAGTGSADLLAELAAKFPTAALAVLDFDTVDWTGLAPATGRLTHFLQSK
ncbi:MAG: histidine phosphatase family protein [Cucumibacter sp.]